MNPPRANRATTPKSAVPEAERSAAHGNARVQAAYQRGLRNAVQWLHERADTMNDPHARSILHSAAHDLGFDKKAL